MQKSPSADHALREQLVRALDWKAAHLGFDDVVARFPAAIRGQRAEGLPYTAWQLLEHMRFTQRDIIEFCKNEDYKEPPWPEAYWPAEPAPPTHGDWDKSVLTFRSDLAELQELLANPDLDLTAAIPHGSGQTYLREALLVIDHNAYHLGQLLVLWRLLSGSLSDADATAE